MAPAFAGRCVVMCVDWLVGGWFGVGGVALLGCAANVQNMNLG